MPAVEEGRESANALRGDDFTAVLSVFDAVTTRAPLGCDPIGIAGAF